MARFHGVDQVDEERVQLTKLEDMNNGILRYLSEEVPTGNADRVCSCAEILQITNHLEVPISVSSLVPSKVSDLSFSPGNEKNSSERVSTQC